MSARMLKPVRGLASGAFFIGLLAVFPGCGNHREEATPTASSNLEVPDQVFDGFEMTITENGIKKGWVRADRAEKYAEKQLFKAVNLTVLFYAATGKVNSVLTSLKGVIHIDSGDMEALDSVVVFSEDSSRTLRTERLLWKKKDNRIVGDTAVVIQSPRGIVYGDGLVTDAGFQNLEVKNPTGDIHVLGDKF